MEKELDSMECGVEDMEDQLEELAKLLKESGSAVAFTGAGVSTESNIPDFRSAGGVYESIQKTYGRPPEELLSHAFFERHPDVFFDYLRKYLVFPKAEPNAAHRSLAALEQAGKLSCVVTQNIDGLHQKAGSRNVCELHGSLYRNYCVSCGERYDLAYVMKSDAVPHCEKCGGIVRPEVVLYGEPLNEEVVGRAVSAIEQADLLLVMGTSLAVYPAAGLLNYFSGKNLVLINRSQTPYDGRASLCIREKAGETMAAALERMEIR